MRQTLPSAKDATKAYNGGMRTFFRHQSGRRPKHYCLRVLAAFALFVPLPTTKAPGLSCNQDAAVMTEYPAHELSPQESLRHYDVVFLGDVAVPSRACSLGFCAGMRVITPIKGLSSGQNMAATPQTILMQVQSRDGGACAPTRFQQKGERWLVFGNYGTTKFGTSYLSSGADSPSYKTSATPDFSSLEGRYLMMRARLDEAVETQLR